MSLTIILAGGKGVRMGGLKPLYAYQGTTLIEATLERLRPQSEVIALNIGRAKSQVATALTQVANRLGLGVVTDDDSYADLGPASGVLAALYYARAIQKPYVITAPCDMPDLPPDYVRRLSDQYQNHPGKRPVYYAGQSDYPLCALWPLGVISSLETALGKAKPTGGLAVWRFLKDTDAICLDAPNDNAFANINAPPNPPGV